MDVQTFGKSIARKFSQIRYRIAESPEIITIITFILVFIFFSFKAPNFLTVYSLSNILTFASITGIIVIGVTFLMISGEFDLSVGSTFAVAGYVFLLSLRADIPPVLAMLMALAVTTLLGAINGLIVIWSGIPSFIATLGTMLAYRGLVRILAAGKAGSYTPAFKSVLFNILNGSITPINRLSDPAGNFRISSLWFIGLVIIMSIVLMRTRFGNRVFAVGGNSEAAKAQGVNVKLTKLLCFSLTGFLAGLAGVILFSQRFSINVLFGTGLELTAVSAVVLGGTLLAGGQGTVVGAAIGVLLLSMLEQGLVLMGVSSVIFWGVVGAIIIISMIANTYLGRKE